MFFHMAGHSKWAQIKRKKGANDVKRGKIFSKLAKEIQVATKLGGGDPDLNPRLRSAILAAKAESVPAENIERAILKGTGDLEGSNAYEELVYEGYGTDGIAILIEALTDNKNRSAAEIRSLFSKNGGSLGAPGSVAWMFERKSHYFFEKGDESKLFEVAVEAGADDVLAGEEGSVEVVAPVEAFDKVDKALRAAGWVPDQSKLSYFPKNETELEGEAASRILKLIEQLEDHDDVQNVFSTLHLSDSLLQSLE